MQNFEEHRESIYDIFSFKTKGGENVPPELIIECSKKFDRNGSVNKINQLICSYPLSQSIEEGVFEATLIYCVSNNICLYENVYNSKVLDICCNLDENDKVMNNKTLRGSILDGKINPHILAFMSYDQIHPSRWKKIIKKRQIRDYTTNNLGTTDMYKCMKCGERKCTSREAMARSADEPMTTVIRCLVCNNTFTR